ncbi:alpha/beta hydrolase [Parasalinivibrio latis]|uniref:alpha/beta fold hydrolase n=1 Tax=Parasalinivibrio latis TaxID=2952610 RepID=UPI0030E298D7
MKNENSEYLKGRWYLSHSLDFEGREIHYDIIGDGEPLVIVHGTPWSSFNLRHLIRGLAGKYKVHYFDLVGYGQSSKEEGDVSLGIQNRILDRLLDHWGLDNPLAIGHDFGGATVLRTHLLNGRPFSKLILIDPVAVSPWGSPFFKHVHKHESAFAGVPDYIHDAIVRAYVKTAAFNPIESETLDGIVAPWTGEKGKAAFYCQIAQSHSAYTEEVQPLYPTISTPTLILWGREDTWIPLDKAHELHSLIPGSNLKVIDGTGHLVIEEKPDALLREIRPFIQEY